MPRVHMRLQFDDAGRVHLVQTHPILDFALHCCVSLAAREQRGRGQWRCEERESIDSSAECVYAAMKSTRVGA